MAQHGAVSDKGSKTGSSLTDQFRGFARGLLASAALCALAGCAQYGGSSPGIAQSRVMDAVRMEVAQPGQVKGCATAKRWAAWMQDTTQFDGRYDADRAFIKQFLDSQCGGMPSREELQAQENAVRAQWNQMMPRNGRF